MTTRRYYHDSYEWEFAATVVESGDGPVAPWAVLDTSSFYPTSGGQPHDTGMLGLARVHDVSVRASDGALIHHLSTPIPTGPVAGTIDGIRRFDHMQQHSGQHILSRAVLQVAGAPTISFHLGTELASIDVEAPRLSEARVAEALELANQVVAANVPIRAWFPSPDELESIPLRKLPEVAGSVRVVAIGEFDFSACGGTHVSRTGEVGLIAALRVEHLKRGTRIEFVAGHRARADYARKHALLRDLGTRLTCATAEVPGAVARLVEELEQARRSLRHAMERSLDAEAARLLNDARRSAGTRIVVRAWPARPVEELKGLATRLTASDNVIALLGAAGARSQLVCARSEGLGLDLKPGFEAALSALGGGKGGGGRLLQGAAGGADVPAIEAGLLAAARAIGVAPA